jgi:diguanylate cyclase (GGDEF)-like protein
MPDAPCKGTIRPAEAAVMAGPASKSPPSASAGWIQGSPDGDLSAHHIRSEPFDRSDPAGALGVLRALVRRFGAATITLAITRCSVLLSMALVALFDQLVKGGVPLVDLIAAALIPAVLAPIATYGFARLSQDLDVAEAQVRALAAHDSLTGVLNHRRFMEAARTELKRLARHGRVATLIFMDADHFKGVNDRLGHAAGDQALIEIAGACRALMRGGDLFGRCGGDDFLMLLSETTPEGAIIVAERIRTSIEGLVFETPAGTVRPTVRIGLATSDVAAPTFDLLYQRADRNLYLAKNRGRNQIAG